MLGDEDGDTTADDETGSGLVAMTSSLPLVLLRSAPVSPDDGRSVSSGAKVGGLSGEKEDEEGWIDPLFFVLIVLSSSSSVSMIGVLDNGVPVCVGTCVPVFCWFVPTASALSIPSKSILIDDGRMEGRRWEGGCYVVVGGNKGI